METIEFLGTGRDTTPGCQPGIFHADAGWGGDDFTLCGITLDGDEETAGDFRGVGGEKINCPVCLDIIQFCKKIPNQSLEPTPRDARLS